MSAAQLNVGLKIDASSRREIKHGFYRKLRYILLELAVLSEQFYLGCNQVNGVAEHQISTGIRGRKS